MVASEDNLFLHLYALLYKIANETLEKHVCSSPMRHHQGLRDGVTTHEILSDVKSLTAFRAVTTRTCQTELPLNTGHACFPNE